MPCRLVGFENQNFYHIFNRGVNKQEIFDNPQDYDRLLQTMFYYQFSGPKPRFSTHKRFKNKDFSSNPKIVEIICFCLMPNHFHFLLKQAKNNGISEFISKVTNSYTKYFNTKYKRVGPLFQGEFKAVLIESDEQLVHVSRYIHLNPFVADLVKNLNQFPYSSYKDFINPESNGFCITKPILDFFKNQKGYKAFTDDHSAYAKELELIKHLLIDE